MTVSLNGSAVVQGTSTQKKRNRCALVTKTDGAARFKLDLGRGTWSAKVRRRDPGPLTNPVDVGITIGDDAGAELLGFRTGGSTWKYARTGRRGKRGR